MKNILKTLSISFLLAGVSFIARSQAIDNELKPIIASEIVKFRQEAAVFNVKVGEVVYTTESRSHVQNADDNIYIDLAEISPYVANESKAFKRTFVKYLLGHEIGHKVHYNSYRADVIKNGRGEGVVFLECFADLYSGFILTQVNDAIDLKNLTENNPNFDITAYNTAQLPVMFKVYQRILEMDQRNTDISTHPSHEQRLVALRQGILLGNCVFNQYMMAHSTPESLGISRALFDNNKNLWDGIGSGLGFNYNDPNNNNFMYWAHLEAIRITNENNSLARKLVRYNVKVAHQHDGDQPVITYSFKIYNENTFSVRFAGRVITELIPRADPGDIVKNGPVDGAPFDVIIGPNEHATLSGTLKVLDDDTYRSRLVIPGDRRSFYFVFAENNPLPDMTYHETFDYDLSRWNSSSLTSIKDLLHDIDTKRGNLLTYAKGIGVSKSDSYDEFVKNKRYFEPIFKAGLESDQQIYYQESDGIVVYTFNACTTMDTNAAASHYSEIVDAITSSFHKYKPQPEDKLTYSTRKEFWDDQSHVAIKVISHDKDTRGRYIISVEVYGSADN